MMTCERKGPSLPCGMPLPSLAVCLHWAVWLRVLPADRPGDRGRGERPTPPLLTVPSVVGPHKSHQFSGSTQMTDEAPPGVESGEGNLPGQTGAGGAPVRAGRTEPC